MAAESLIKLKLSVWRDFVPSRALIFRPDSAEGHHVLATDSDLQQEVYAWQMREDPFDGVSDEAARMRLRELLIDRFEASKHPSLRRVEAMRDFLNAAYKVIDSGQAEWTGSQDAPDDEDDVPYRLNPLLALVLHLDWLAASFADQPGISVSVR